MRPGSHDGLALDFEALHLQWEKSVLLYVTFAISKLGAWGGTFQLSPVQPVKLVGAPEEGGRTPVRKKSKCPVRKKSFEKSFRTISKNALPQIVKKSFPAISRTTKYIYNYTCVYAYT